MMPIMTDLKRQIHTRAVRQNRRVVEIPPAPYRLLIFGRASSGSLRCVSGGDGDGA